MIGRTLSRYRIVEQIGSGGMGVVYEAEDVILKRRVAVKTLKESNAHKPRLLREARAVSDINHPNIATVYDFGETEEGQPFIVMELVEGKPLDEYVRNNCADLAEIIEIIIKTADALATVDLPVRVMVGDRDATVTLDETAAAYRALPRGELAVLPRTGHPLEQVDVTRLAGELVDLLRRADAPDATLATAPHAGGARGATQGAAARPPIATA